MQDVGVEYPANLNGDITINRNKNGLLKITFFKRFRKARQVFIYNGK